MKKIRNILILAIITISMLMPVIGNAATLKQTHYCRCSFCCDPWTSSGKPTGTVGAIKKNGTDGATSTGVMLNTKNSLIAVASTKYAKGTIIYSPYRHNGDTTGGYMVIVDNGGYHSIDISVTLPSQGGNRPYSNSHQKALEYGTVTTNGAIVYEKKLPLGDVATLQKYSESQALLAEYVGGGAVPVPDEVEVPEVPEATVSEVTAAFDLWINGEWMGIEGTNQSTAWAEKINTIEIVDKSSELGKVVACSIKNMQTGKLEPISFDKNTNTGTLKFTDLSYEKYVNLNKQMEVVLQVEGTTSASKLSRIINVVNVPIEPNFEIYINGVAKDAVSVKTNEVIPICEERINTIEFVDKSNIKGRVTGFYIMTADPATAKWEWIKGDRIEWNDECYEKYVNQYNEIVILQETTEANKNKIVKLQLISGKEIGVRLGDKEYEATKENPMKEPVFLNSLVLINRTGKEISQWQILNYKTGAYGPAEMIYNEILFKEENYKPLGNNKYVIMIKAILDNGESVVREVYIDFFTVTSPINGSIVKKENQLVIKWDGDPEREYKLRMVKYFLDENGNEIEEYKITLMDKVKKGNEEVIEKIGTAGNYRIAIKDNEGQFYSIILFKAE